MRCVVLLAFAVNVWAGAGFDHSAWDRVLKAHVNTRGEVDYRAIQRDRKDLDAYLASLRDQSPVKTPALFPTHDDALAYWINAYNAFVTSGIAVKYPVRSVRDLGFALGFFRAKDYVAGGAALSLNDIEHGIIRKQFKEPRIHFAIVCASLGCPYLAREAYSGPRLQQQLDRQAREFVNAPRNMAIDGSQITLSKIFDWYGDDFGGRAALAPFLVRYANDANRAALLSVKNPKIRFRDYDWNINDPGSRKAT
jgi:hypothetical protein